MSETPDAGASFVRLADRATQSAAAEDIYEVLVRNELITAEQLQRAFAEARATNTSVDFQLDTLGYITGAELVRAVAHEYKIPAVDLNRVTVSSAVIDLVPSELAFRLPALPLRRTGSTLTVALAYPNDAGAIDALGSHTGFDIEPVVVSEHTLLQHLAHYYPDQAKSLSDSSVSRHDVAAVEQVRGGPASPTPSQEVQDDDLLLELLAQLEHASPFQSVEIADRIKQRTARIREARSE